MDKRTALIRLRTLKELKSSGMNVGGYIQSEIDRIEAALQNGTFPVKA